VIGPIFNVPVRVIPIFFKRIMNLGKMIDSFVKLTTISTALKSGTALGIDEPPLTDIKLCYFSWFVLHL